MNPHQPPYVPYTPPPQRSSPAPGILLGCGGLAVLGLLALVALVAVSPDPKTSTSARATVTVTVTQTAAAPPVKVSKTEEVPVAKPTKARVVKVKVPNVVGRNHQEAQDYLQSLGFYGLAEEDATGQGRALLWDRNWVVVRQSPKAGTLADPETATITLYSKKIGE